MKTKKELSKIRSKARSSGKRFEIKIREDLESKGFLVFRNSNDVKKIETPNGQSIQFKQTTGHWNPFTKMIMVSQSGFPDFIVLKEAKLTYEDETPIEFMETPNVLFNVAFVECKLNGYINKVEKEKVNWLIKNLHVPFYVASKEGKKINYLQLNIK